MTTEIDYKQLFEQQHEQIKQLQLLIEQLQQQIEQLLRARFGKKSERRPKNKVAHVTSTPSPRTQPTEEKRGRALPESFPRVEMHHDVSEEQKQCPQCHSALTPIKSLEREQWAYRPGTLYVKKHLRHRYACRRCQQILITATLLAPPIEKGVADSSLLAQVIIDKYQDHLPLYRQEQRWLRHGVTLSRQTLCEWAMNCSTWLGFLVSEMKKDILASRKISSDDTPYPILAPGKTHQGRLWVYIGGGGHAPPIAVIYEYTETRSHQGPLNFLQGFQGFLQADAYAGYDKVYESGKVIEVACWAHCRRKFVDAYECADDNKVQSKSHIALEFIAQLYQIEQQCKLMTTMARFYYRRQYAKLLLKKFHRWLRYTRSQLFPKSLLGKAVNYALNHWRALMNYCREGTLDIDNNISERAIKPCVLGRKNYLFAGSMRVRVLLQLFTALLKRAKCGT